MTLITFDNNKAIFRDGAVGTEQACCCETSSDDPSSDCCCVGTSAITTDEFGNPIDVDCLAISEVEAGSCGNPTVTETPTDFAPVAGSTIVVEWCGLSVSLTCGSGTGNEEDVELSENFPFGPGLCNENGIEVTRRFLKADFACNVIPFTGCYSSCPFGCGIACNNRPYIRFSVFMEESGIGGVALRLLYVTQRSGCDDELILETPLDDGLPCCPELPEIEITFAP